jgi:hypothetical protein
MSRLAAIALSFAIAAPLHAQEASGDPRAVAEPKVQRTLIEDRGAKIEELRVRGQLQRVVVTPKGGARPYEIVTPEGGRDTSVDANNNRGAAGKRVWHVFSF